MPSGQDVRFIRRHGRIIPIRLNREKGPRRRGYGLIGAGAVVAGGSAAASAGLVVNADRIAKRVGNVLSNINKVKGKGFVMYTPKAYDISKLGKVPGITNASLGRALRVGTKGYKAVKTQLGLSKAVLRGGVGLGTGLFAAGMLRAISQKDRPGSEGLVGAIAGVSAWTLSNKVFRHIVKRKIGF